MSAFCTEFLGTTLTLTGREFASPADLLERVAQHAPDLICTYRNLHSETWKYPYSLGEHLDVLTQMTSAPVLVLPHPRAHERAFVLVPWVETDPSATLRVGDRVVPVSELIPPLAQQAVEPVEEER